MGFLDAIGFGADDPAPDLNTTEGLIRHLNTPSQADRRMAFFKTLSAMGRGGTGAAAQASSDYFGQQKAGKLDQLQTNAALRKLLMPVKPTRRESFGKDAQGNPIKFYENEDPETGKVSRIQGSEVPLWNPKDMSMTDWQKFQSTKPVAPSASSGSDYVVIQTPTGAVNFNKVTGVATPVAIGGKPVIGTSSDASFIADKEREKSQVKAASNLPQIETNANEAIATIDRMIGNKEGREYATGTSSYLPIIGGTKAADFKADSDTLKGGVFLKAFEALKGGGQITEIEGKKAEAAMARLDAAQTEESYMTALNDLKAAISEGVKLAKGKAGAPMQNTDDDLINKYLVK